MSGKQLIVFRDGHFPEYRAFDVLNRAELLARVGPQLGGEDVDRDEEEGDGVLGARRHPLDAAAPQNDEYHHEELEDDRG